MRKTITIPENPKYFPLTGSSVIIESAGLYSGVEQVPLISFDNASADFPLYPHSVYQNPEGNFNRILIEPTPESAGDEITILSFDECLESNLKIAFSGSKKTICGTTFSITSTDAGQSLSSLQIQKNGLFPTAMYISAENADINYAFDTIADQSSNNHSLAATKNENATGSIVVTAQASAGENFNMYFYGQSVTIPVAVGDTLQEISNFIQYFLENNTVINSKYVITNENQTVVPVSIIARNTGTQYNQEITADNAEVDLSIESPIDGQNKAGEMIKIVGIDFIQKFTFASAVAGSPANLVVTTEY